MSNNHQNSHSGTGPAVQGRHAIDIQDKGALNLQLDASNGESASDEKLKQGDEKIEEHVQLNQPQHAHVAKPTVIIAEAATLHSRWKWLNWTWGILFTMLLPAMGTIIWWGLIPVGNPSGEVADKAIWVFFLHPINSAFHSFLLISLFTTALNEDYPWRPFSSYVHILVANYIAQVILPGLVVLLYQPYELLALPAMTLTFIITIVGIRLTPLSSFCASTVVTQEKYNSAFRVFVKISIVFIIYSGVLAVYVIANAFTTSTGRGFLTVFLAIISFIFKKTLLSMTDPIGLETAMLVAGFWIENLTDCFITLAFPTTGDFGATFAVIFLQRVAENMAYLGFQLDTWFRFRVWIKAVFKKQKGVAIEEDLPEAADDRGHSSHHPGYLRRQLRFLVLKLFSQMCSYVYFAAVVPVLRFGPNKDDFPYQNATEEGVRLLEGIELRLDDEDSHSISRTNFAAAMVFCGIQMLGVLAGGALIWLWMMKYRRNILNQIRERYNVVVVHHGHYGFILITMVSNALIATSFVQVYYRVYFL